MRPVDYKVNLFAQGAEREGIMKSKKIISLLCATAMMASVLAGCGGSSAPTESASSDTDSTAATETTTETATEKPTEPPKVSETAKIVTGIDISHWQSDRGKINWTQVKNDGIDYVIIKAAGRSISSSGSLYEDTAFKENIEGARATGMDGIVFESIDQLHSELISRGIDIRL